MKRGKYQTKTPGYEDWVMGRERKHCDYCGKQFTYYDKIQCHHVKHPRHAWKVSKFDVSLRATKVHAHCHIECHSMNDTERKKGPEMVVENLLERFGDCELSDRLEQAGYNVQAK